MLHSMNTLDKDGGLYEINNTTDYQLEKVVSAGITETNALFNYIGSLLFDTIPGRKQIVKFGSGCSAFAATEASGRVF